MTRSVMPRRRWGAWLFMAATATACGPGTTGPSDAAGDATPSETAVDGAVIEASTDAPLPPADAPALDASDVLVTEAATDAPQVDSTVDAGFDAPIDARADVVATDALPEAGGRDVVSDAPVSTSPCPAELPTGDQRCTREGLACQYGSDPRESCRPMATCTDGAWQVTVPRCMPLTEPAMCPATREAAAGQDCRTMGAVCAYDGQFCECTNCRSFPVGGCGGTPRWRCTAPSANPACPAAQPNLGAACTAEGQTCSYDCEAYGTNGSRQCRDGIWIASPSPCPISTRRAKQNIAYVTVDEAEHLAAQTLQTRLATYEYTDPALRGPRRLGFILEDQPTNSYARNPEASAVDLYGYTSMLLATVQSQQRQLDALRREVEALRVRRPARR